MKNIAFPAMLFCLSLFSFSLHSQSLDHTNWRAFFKRPFADSMTLHIQGDSSFVSRSNGEVFSSLNCSVSGDTIVFKQNKNPNGTCPGIEGRYRIVLKGDTLAFELIEDGCEMRAQSLLRAVFVRVSQ